MNAMLVENIINWFLFALASTCTLSFASTVYDHFISSKRGDRNKNAKPRIVPLSNSQASSLEAKKPAVRGYDTPELFREDLWVRRIEHSRKEHAALLASMPPLKAGLAPFEDTPRRLCEILILAQHTQPGRDN